MVGRKRWLLRVVVWPPQAYTQIDYQSCSRISEQKGLPSLYHSELWYLFFMQILMMHITCSLCLNKAPSSSCFHQQIFKHATIYWQATTYPAWFWFLQIWKVLKKGTCRANETPKKELWDTEVEKAAAHEHEFPKGHY